MRKAILVDLRGAGKDPVRNVAPSDRMNYLVELIRLSKRFSSGRKTHLQESDVFVLPRK